MSLTEGSQNRNEEATNILLKQALKINPNLPSNQNLKNVLDFFKSRNESGAFETLKTGEDKRVKALKEILAHHVNKDDIIECCKDKFLIEALGDCIDQRIDPKYIIEYISGNSTTKTDLAIQNISFIEDLTADNTEFHSVSEGSKTVILKTDNHTNFSQNPNIMNSTPLSANTQNRNNITPRMNSFSINSSLGQVRPLSIKDALELIPKFNGTNISLSQFIEGCREACSIIPEQFEADLAKLIKLRLYGEALRSVSGRAFESIDQLAKFFDNIFGSAKTYHELHGELSKMRQSREENVVVFSNRVRSIGQEILEAERREKRISKESYRILEKDLVKFFIRGLHWVIKARMGETHNLESATAAAIEIERDFACYESDEINDTVKRITENKSNKVKEEKIYVIDTKQGEVCQMCNRVGHIAPNCRTYNGNSQNVADKQTIVKWTDPRTENTANRWPQNRFTPITRTAGDQYVQRQKATFSPQNNPERKFCRYCKKDGDTIDVCRKREYYNKGRNSEVQAGNGSGRRPGSARREPDTIQRSNKNTQ